MCIERGQVIDIVRSNVRALLQQLWKMTEVEGLRLHRLFGRIFNRMLWNNGRGLLDSLESR